MLGAYLAVSSNDFPLKNPTVTETLHYKATCSLISKAQNVTEIYIISQFLVLPLHLFASCLLKDNIFALFEHCSNFCNLVGNCYVLRNINLKLLSCSVHFD